MPRSICFMIMPFGTKDTQPPPAGSPAGTWPAKINFDALWEKAFAPAIEALGYKSVRADQDLGALIIQEMLERLYFSDLVLADMTLPNGNVYYEVGIRHATKAKGCVLLAANWSQALFDVNQMRRVPYPLPESEITDETAQAIRQVLEKAVPALAEGDSPMFQALPGFPSNVDQSWASSIQDQLQALSRFQAQLRAVRAQQFPL